MATEDTVAEADGGRVERSRDNMKASTKRRNGTQKWMRRLHMWTSMTTLLIVLFFSVTGITLNHPTWTFGQNEVTADTTGTFPSGTINGSTVDWLKVSEYLRANQGARGEITDHSIQNGEGSISYRAPGYSADVTFPVSTGAFTMHSATSGLAAVFNDLHKGRHTSGWWKWLIDITAGILVLIALTGIVLQLTIRRTKRSAMIMLAAGTVIGGLLVYLAM